MPDLRLLDDFFLAAAAAFSLAILSDATAVGTEQGWPLPQVTARACSQLDPGASTWCLCGDSGSGDTGYCGSSSPLMV